MICFDDDDDENWFLFGGLRRGFVWSGGLFLRQGVRVLIPLILEFPYLGFINEVDEDEIRDVERTEWRKENTCDLFLGGWRFNWGSERYCRGCFGPNTDVTRKF